MTAASTGSSPAGAVTMFAFGLGTAPAMLGLTLAAPALQTFLNDRFVRRIVGFSLVVLALWMVYGLVAPAAGGHSHHA
jgi:sulfite exporter TauE/SafE